MAEAIVEELDLDISAALASVDTLSSALDSAASDFGANVADAISAAFGNITLPELDAGSITSGLDSAFGGIGTITPQVDESAIEQQVNDALDAPRAPIEVNADTAPVQDAIDAIDTATVGTNLSASLDGAVSNVPPVDVQADTTGAQASIDGLGSSALDVPVSGDVTELQNVIDGVSGTTVDVPVTGDVTTLEDAIASVQPEPVDVPVTADTTEAQDAIDNLSGSASDATSSVDGLAVASKGVSAATGLAQGSVSDLAGSLTALSGGVGDVVVAGTAFTALLGVAINRTADAQAQQQRFNEVFGASASIVQNINVGGLVTSFDELARVTGTSVPDLEAAASKLGQIGESAGVATPQVAKTTEGLLALAGTLSVTNPRLGDTATVANLLETALIRPGQRLAALGLAFTQAQLQEEAFRETGKTTAAELTSYDKIQAGVTLGLQQFGDALGTKFAVGAQNAQVQFRALKNEVEDSLIALGAPLVSPVEGVLRDVVPIAIDVGTVLGNLAQVVLPALGAAAALLAPVDGALKLVGDGLAVISSALSHLPAPAQLALLAVGMGAFAVATGTADVAIAAFATALDVALGPVGILLAAIAAIGAAFDLFGSHSSAAATASKDWTQALFANSDTAQGLSTDIANLNRNLAANETKFIESFKVGSDFRQALDGIGGGTSGLNAALLGTSTQFATYKQNVEAAAIANGEFAGDAVRQGDALTAQRQGLQASIQGQLQSYISTNQLTQAQLLQLEATHRLADGTVDWAGVLAQANLGVDAFNEKQAASAVSSGIASGALLNTLSTYTLAQGGAEALTAAIAQLNLSQTDAKTLGKDVADATQQQADAQASAAPAAANLAAQFATGQISAGQYAAQLLQMGVSVNGLSTAMSEGQKAASDYQTALTASSDASLLGSSSATRLRTALLDGSITAAQAQAGFEGLGVSVKGAEDALKQTSDAATELADSVKKLPTAADAITSYSQTVASDTQKIATDMKDVAAKHKGATTSLLDDTKQLANDTSPQKFINNLTAETLQIAAFQHNLQTLVSEGFTNLAATLAAQGPVVAGGLAGALAGSPTQAAAANAAQTNLNAFTSKFDSFASGLSGRLSGAGVNMGHAFTGGVDIGLSGLVADVNTRLAQAGQALTTDPAIANAARAAGDTVTNRFNEHVDLRTGTIRRSSDAATYLISGGNPIPGAASTSAATANAFYEGALGLPGSTSSQVSAASAAFGAQARVDLYGQATNTGHTAGVLFDQGMASGLRSASGDIAAAARTAAAQAEAAAKQQLGIASPSKVGFSIGQAFVEGVTSGLDAHSAVTVASVNLTDTILKSLDGLTGAAFKAAHDSVGALSQIDPRAGAAAGATLDLSAREFAISREKADAIRARREAEFSFAAGDAAAVKTDLARAQADLVSASKNEAREQADRANLERIQAQNTAALHPALAPLTLSPAVTPFVAAGNTTLTQQLVVNVTMQMPDGSTVNGKTEPIAVPPSRPGQLQQLVVAEVKAL